MKEHPILFQGAMVRAILNGRKTQTRRVVKDMPPMPEVDCHKNHKQKHELPYFDAYCGQQKTAENPRGMGVNWNWWQVDDRACLPQIKCPYGQVGDSLWVRETYCFQHYENGFAFVTYHADEEIKVRQIELGHEPKEKQGSHPSIHMPRWASRITLEITDIRVERLQDISEADALAEGITYAQLPENAQDTERAKTWYRGLWAQINGFESWESNPFVWVVEFKVVKP